MIVTIRRIKLPSELHLYRTGKTSLNFWESYSTIYMKNIWLSGQELIKDFFPKFVND